MGDKSWEEMAREVLVEGRPDKVQSAALGWKELIKNLGQVKESLETNVKDLGVAWKGPAYESFKTHIEGLAKSAGTIIDDVDKPGRGRVSIVTTLETAATQLQEAQSKMPIPAACVGDVLAARNGEITLGVGIFETKVKADLMGSWPVEQLGKLGDWVTSWFSDKEGEAREIYNEVNNNFKQRSMEAPGNVSPTGRSNTKPEIPELETGGGGGGGNVKPPSLGGGGGGGLGGGPKPDTGKMPDLPSTTTGPGDRPDIPSSDYPGRSDLPDTGDYPGYDPDSDGYGTGLAGAAPPTTTGLGSGPGLGNGPGLGGGPGLSGGSNASLPPGLGKPVSPGLPPMLGGGMGGGAGGRGAGGKLGGARPGMAGAMAPGG
ncbi:hypothetical protein, partial [Micromonospora olivasterospora]